VGSSDNGDESQLCRGPAPHPDQVSLAERCAIQHFPRPCDTVGAAGMGWTAVLLHSRR